MRLWFRRIIILLGIYQFLRLLFFFSNQHSLIGLSTLDIVFAFMLGVRFDACIIATINLPLLMIHSLRGNIRRLTSRKLLDNVVNIFFVFANLPIIVVGLVDSRLFTFSGRRTSPELFSIGQDIGQQSVGLLTQYWGMTIFGVMMCIVFAMMTWQLDHSPSHRRSLNLKIPLRLPKIVNNGFTRKLAFVAIGCLLIRGGLQRKPLAPTHAYAWPPNSYANLILNSGMTLLRSPRSESVTQYDDFSSIRQARDVITAKRIRDANRLPLASGKNFVVIVVESLASEYVGALNGGPGYTPFLDTLIAKSVNFSESFANGRRSIDAMPAIFAGIPAWRDQPFVTSPYSGNDFVPVPTQLKKAGYTSAFFHGAANGSMHFDVFSAMAGFDKYVGINEYPSNTDHDGQWGVFDEPFLSFVADSLTKFTTPFFAGVFTLSSHNPFPVPAKYRDKFPKGTLPIHESIGYADYSLGRFFAKAASLPWYANTIFIITGDHTSLSEKSVYNNVLGRFRVPIIFFDPSDSLPHIGRTKVAQHIDIAATVFDLASVTVDDPTLFGWSLFDPKYDGHFIQSEYGQWYYYDQELMIHLDDSSSRVFSGQDPWMERPLELTDAMKHKIELFKAYRQYYANGLTGNSWRK